MWRVMSNTEPPAGPPRESWASPGGVSNPPFDAGPGAGPVYVPVTPLLADDPPRIDEFWLDARLGATPAGIAFTAHDPANTPAMVILLAEGAAADPAARARFAGEINALHIDKVLARGGQGQDTGRLGRKYRGGDDNPVAPDDRLVAPWAALAYDGSPATAAQAIQILDAVEIATLLPFTRIRKVVRNGVSDCDTRLVSGAKKVTSAVRLRQRPGSAPRRGA